MRGSRYDQQRPGGEPVVIADPPLVESTSQRFLGVPLRRTEAEIPESVSSWSGDGPGAPAVTSALDGPTASLHELLTADLNDSGSAKRELGHAMN